MERPVDGCRDTVACAAGEEGELGGDGILAFGAVAGDGARDAQGGGFLDDAAGVGQTGAGGGELAQEGRVGERSDPKHVIRERDAEQGGFDFGIRVDGPEEVGGRMLDRGAT